MGILVLPIFLLMLLGFSYQGLTLGVDAILRSQGRPTAVLTVVAMSMGLALAAIVLPFLVVASKQVSQGGFVAVAVCSVGGIAWLSGTRFRELYAITDRPIHGLSGAAFFLAAASFPIMWFWLAEKIGVWFQVGWVY